MNNIEKIEGIAHNVEVLGLFIIVFCEISILDLRQNTLELVITLT